MVSCQADPACASAAALGNAPKVSSTALQGLCASEKCGLLADSLSVNRGGNSICTGSSGKTHAGPSGVPVLAEVLLLVLIVAGGGLVTYYYMQRRAMPPAQTSTAELTVTRPPADHVDAFKELNPAAKAAAVEAAGETQVAARSDAMDMEV